MNIHEYQAKNLLRSHGVNVPDGVVIFSLEELDTQINKEQNGYVLKAQIHAGGRGKAGGVKIVGNFNALKEAAEEMMGKTLITHQTGPAGQKVRRLYVESLTKIKKEYYISLVVNRDTGGISMIASSEGGMDIEEVAEHNPEKIVTIDVDVNLGMQPFYIRKMGFKLGLDKIQISKLVPMIQKIYETFVATNAEQIEINPLVETEENENNETQFIALDAKINFDSNALYRHPDIMSLRDKDEEDEIETEAEHHEISYVRMDGEIGCMVNGAGLAMSTMDIIKYYGSEPANFLDIGGSATQARVEKAFKIILSDPSVKAILVNIFGGIVKCDMIADGIIEAAKDIKLKVPLVVRLSGTNSDIGKFKLSKCDIPGLIAADDLADAAKTVVDAVKNQK